MAAFADQTMPDNGKVNIGSRVASTIGWAELGGHFPNENTLLIEGGKVGIVQ